MKTMKMLQTGDRCPICGQPIQTKDPNKLIFLSAMGWWDEQKTDGEADLCGLSSVTATNADKIRSLPDDELAGEIMCPGTQYAGTPCRELTGNPDDPQPSCNDCSVAWVTAPYNGWDDD